MTAALLPHAEAFSSQSVNIAEKHAVTPFQDVLSYALSRRLTAQLRLWPHQITLHVHDGAIRGAEGHLPLGAILLHNKLCDPSLLEAALSKPGKLGQNLMEMGLKPVQLRAALKAQAHATLQHLLQHPPTHYELKVTAPLPSPGAGLTSHEVLSTLHQSAQQLPLGNVYQLAAPKSVLTIEPQALELMRWINGRRTLGRALELSSLEPAEYETAAQFLLLSGLIELSVVFGLRMIVPKLRPADALTQPPAGLKANLFLRRVNGENDVISIANMLKITQQEACLILTSMYRDHVIEIQHGQAEFQRLLEEF